MMSINSPSLPSVAVTTDQAVLDGTKSTKPRYVFVDALRGIACLGVLFHHLLHNTVLEVTLRKILPGFIQVACQYGARGVQIFFIISGFVIAHSLRDFVPSARNIGSFIVRRQLRLDPAYWVIILVTLLLTAVENGIPGLQHKSLPEALVVVANMFYLQNILSTTHVVGVAWTLCIEIQFYLVFVLLIAFAARALRGRSNRLILTVLVAALGLFSLTRGTWSPWFIPFWCYFAGGVLCYWAVIGRISYWVPVAYAAAMLAATLHHGADAMAFGLATIVALTLCGWLNTLTRWSGGKVLQYFGRISYSLYLVHLTVVSCVMRAGYKLTGTNAYASLGWLSLAALASVVAAHVLYRLVERPTMRLGSSLKAKLEKSDHANVTIPTTVIADDPRVSPAVMA